MTGDVRDNAAEHRYEIRVGNDVAFLKYFDTRRGPRSLIHTEVPPSLQGKGIAGRLVKAALDDAQTRGLRIVPVCPFVKSYLARHPEYSDRIWKN